MKGRLRSTVNVVLVGLAWALVALQASAAPPLPGAIFTTTENGDVVNGNTIYADICDVFLDGGPGPNAPRTAAGLPDDDYYFQVTDPSGKKLLSTDPVEERCITVVDGIIVDNCPTGTHFLGTDMDQGPTARTVQLCPYDLTPNNGGVHKVWVTPVGDGTVAGGGFVGDPTQVDNPCGNGCFHGFVPARSKTDNFKIGDKEPTFCIDVHKQILDKKKKVLVPGGAWDIQITDPLGVTNNFFTDANGFLEVCGLTQGTYTVTESLENSGSIFDVIFTEVNGVAIEPPTDSVEVMLGRGKPDPALVRFINLFVCDTKDKDCK